MTEVRWICKTMIFPDGSYGKWLPIEPAPPTSWRPVCFYNWSDKLGLCEMSDLKEFVKDHLANCEQCPYRKME